MCGDFVGVCLRDTRAKGCHLHLVGVLFPGGGMRQGTPFFELIGQTTSRYQSLAQVQSSSHPFAWQDIRSREAAIRLHRDCQMYKRMLLCLQR